MTSPGPPHASRPAARARFGALAAALALAHCTAAPGGAHRGVLVVVRSAYAAASPGRVDRYRLRVYRRDAGSRRWVAVVERMYYLPGTDARGLGAAGPDAGVQLIDAEGRHELLPDGAGDVGPVLVEAQGGLAQSDPGFAPVGLPAVAQFEFPTGARGTVDLALDPACRNVQDSDHGVASYFRTCVAQPTPSGGATCPVFVPICWAFDATSGAGHREECACGGPGPDGGAPSVACGAVASGDAGTGAACPDAPVVDGGGDAPDASAMDDGPAASFALPGAVRVRGDCTEACAPDGNWTRCVAPPSCGAVPDVGDPCCGADVSPMCPPVDALPSCGALDRVCNAMGLCERCGGDGEACCPGAHCADGSDQCFDDGHCHACGALGQPCCPGNQCAAGACYGGTCACGGPGQVCCGGACSAGDNVCDPAGSNTCVACGAPGQPCCAGANCITQGAQLVNCYFGRCVACGGQCQSCCYMPGDVKYCPGVLRCDTGRGPYGTCCENVPCNAPSPTCHGG